MMLIRDIAKQSVGNGKTIPSAMANNVGHRSSNVWQWQAMSPWQTMPAGELSWTSTRIFGIARLAMVRWSF
jgi:hypothetical protein